MTELVHLLYDVDLLEHVFGSGDEDVDDVGLQGLGDRGEDLCKACSGIVPIFCWYKKDTLT